MEPAMPQPVPSVPSPTGALSRRGLLVAGAGAAGAAALGAGASTPATAAAAGARSRRLVGDPFTLGVASGDP
ncbi:alkaline phosphatase, partial [Vallicoccus soli]